MKRTICLAAALMAWADAAPAAQATPQQIQRRCFDYSLRPAEQAAACTAAIALYGNTQASPSLLALAYLARGTAHSRAGDRTRAQADHREAIRLHSMSIDAGVRDVTIYNDRCWARAVAMIDLDAALADCNEALRLMPAFVAALDSRAFVHMRRGRFREAITDYDAALKEAPRDPWSLYGRGMAKLRLGDSAGAQADIAAAKEIEDVSAEFAAYGFSP